MKKEINITLKNGMTKTHITETEDFLTKSRTVGTC